MFEDDTNYDFTDDILQTSFATTNRQLNNFVGETNKIGERIGKKTNSKIDFNEEILNKNKFDIPGISNVSENFKSSSRTPVERKFPGPAGLLPDDCDNHKSLSEIFHSDNIQKSNNLEMFLCSQQNFSVFEKSPWKNMVADFQDTQRELLFEKFNISWIKANFSEKKQMMNCKSPFLACAIDNLELIDGKIPTVKVVLKDKTGTIQGTILHSLYKEYSNYFTVESVLILKQFGVLSAHNSHCLTITPNNLLTIYHLNTDLRKDEKLETQAANVEKIVLQKYSIESIWAKYDESQTNNCNYKTDFTFRNSFKHVDNRNRSKLKTTFYNKNLSLNTKGNVSKICFKNVYSKDSLRNHQSENVENHVAQNLSEISKSVQPNSTVTCLSSSQISVTSDRAHLELWQDLFQEVDTDALFDDF